MNVRIGILAPAGAEQHVAADVSGEQDGLLSYIADAVIQGVEGVVPNVHPVHQHSALRGIIEPGGQADQSGLAAAGGADKGHGLPPLGLEGDVLQDILVRGGIVEGDVPELHSTGFQGIDAGALSQAVPGLQHLIDPLGGHLGRREHHDNHDHHHNGHDDVGGVGAEHHDVAEGGQPCGGVRGRDGVHDGGTHPVDHQRQCVHGQGDAGHQEGKGPLVEQLRAHQFLVALPELGVLVVLSVVGVDNIDTVQVLPGHQVDMVGELLHPAEPGHHHADDDRHHHQQGGHKSGGDSGEGPTLAHDFDDGPHCHDGGLD